VIPARLPRAGTQETRSDSDHEAAAARPDDGGRLGTANFHTVRGWVSADLRWLGTALEFTVRTGSACRDSVELVGTMPQVLVVSPTLKVNTLQELMALARSQPGKLNHSSSSATGRVASEAFRQMAGIDAVPVPYKTSAQAITDLISGQLHFLVTDAGLGGAQAQAGRVRRWRSRRRAASPRSPSCRR